MNSDSYNGFDVETSFRLHAPPPRTPISLEEITSGHSAQREGSAPVNLVPLSNRPKIQESGLDLMKQPYFDSVLEIELFGGCPRSRLVSSTSRNSLGLSPGSTGSLATSSSSHSFTAFGSPSSASTSNSSSYFRFSPPQRSHVTGSETNSSIPIKANSAINLLHPEYSLSPLRPETRDLLTRPSQTPRRIPSHLMRVLDAPDLVDDFYSDVLDWSSKDILGVGLGRAMWTWKSTGTNVMKIFELTPARTQSDFPGLFERDRKDRLSAVKFETYGSKVAVGTKLGLIQIWDVQTQKLIRTVKNHSSKVGAFTWNHSVLSSGSAEGLLVHTDVRAAARYINKHEFKKNPICGVEWSPDGAQLAVGTNQNACYVFDGVASPPALRLKGHSAAVKALAWSPHQRGVLVTGAGNQDTHLRSWRTTTGELIASVPTEAQICNLLWSKTTNEIVTSHGYARSGADAYCLRFWKYPQLSTFSKCKGSSRRILFLTLSPDGSTIVTGSGDETLRFYEAFPAKQASRDSSRFSPLNPGNTIR